MLVLLLVAAPAEALEWLPLDGAVTAARAEGRLILLHERGSAETDEWIAHADSHDVLRELLSHFVLARSGARAARPRLLVLDPAGEMLGEVRMEEYGALAAHLQPYQQQAQYFVGSVRAREAGRLAEALLLRGNGLLNAGGKPREILTKAQELARAEHNDPIAQDAEIGLAFLDSRERARNPLRRWKEVAEHPAVPELGARAWLLIGHELRMRGFRREAIDAYQHAGRLAPKGSALATSVRRVLEMNGSLPESDVAAAAASGGVRLLFPRRTVMAGPVELTAVAPPNAARVEFYLDDARVAERGRAPFAATIALGALPRLHVLRIIAYDAGGAVLGEDSATLNERAAAFGVEIVAPRDPIVQSRTEVQVLPHVPEGGRVESVDLYWNDQKLATLTSPPFRYSLTLPSPRAFGYIRAVGHDGSGTTAEDAKLINSAGSAAEVRVDAVELHAIVQDRDGHLVGGLTAKDFEVKEDGVAVPVDVRSEANEAITVGIAVDVSASMRPAFSALMEYATEFLKHSLSPADRTFVVDFAEQPELFQPLTSDFEHVSTSLLDMGASGATALWDGIVFSLDQLRAVEGKRALLVFTDGDDNGSRTAGKAMLEYARQVGVPIYVVLLYTQPVTSFVLDNGYGSVSMLRPADRDDTIERLAEETGGMIVRYPRQSDLPRLFQQVRDDTRGAYTLTFVSPSTKKRGDLRKISVGVVGRRGLVVRAPSAYYPR